MDARSPGYWITPLLLGVLAGTALQLQQAELLARDTVLHLALLGMCCVAVRRFSPRVLLFLAAALLAFAQVEWRAAAFEAQSLQPAIEGRDVVVTGVIAAMPQRTEAGLRLRVEVDSATADDGAVPIPRRIAVGWYGDPQTLPDVRAGERWRFATRLKAPHGASNPHGFDFELWMWEQDLQASGSVRAGPREPAPERLEATWRHPVESARQRVRDAIHAQVTDRRSAGVIAALVVGDQAAIERNDWDVFRATGAAHLMSISGLHVTMFAWAAAALAGAAWRRSARMCLLFPAQHAAALSGVALAWGYAVFSGWGVPAQRTIVMLATVALLRLWGRRWPWTHVWLLSCAAVVIVDPWAMLQAGFWLSFVAVGVLFAGGTSHRPAPGWKGRLQAAAREQAIVTVALAPLTLLLFGQVSLVGLVANAIAIPWVTLVATPLAMAGIAFAPAWTAAALAVDGLGRVLQWFANWPLASWSAPAAPLWAALPAVAGGVLLALRVPMPLKTLALPLVLPALLWQLPRPASGEFELLFADVGQGNAVVLRTASHTLLYDTGPRFGTESDAGHRMLVPLLRAMGERVDTVVLSHRDSDHTGGAPAVLAMQADAALLSSIESGHELQQLRPAARCAAGQGWEWDGVLFQVVHPQASDYDRLAKPNALSCVLRVVGAHASALLAGDIEAAQEARLAGEPSIAADILLVPHHGSRTSSTAPFLAAVHPSVAFVQAGWRNRFGHPVPEVVQRYGSAGIRVVDSPHCGAGLWRSATPGDVQCHRNEARRYWHHRVP
jgi:competence protein ComEC